MYLLKWNALCNPYKCQYSNKYYLGFYFGLYFFSIEIFVLQLLNLTTENSSNAIVFFISGCTVANLVCPFRNAHVYNVLLLSDQKIYFHLGFCSLAMPIVSLPAALSFCSSSTCYWHFHQISYKLLVILLMFMIILWLAAKLYYSLIFFSFMNML